MGKMLYTRKEAAALLSVSVDTLDALRYEKKIRACNIGCRVYVSADELSAFVRRLEDGKC